jgi:hypothetical protein
VSDVVGVDPFAAYNAILVVCEFPFIVPVFFLILFLVVFFVVIGFLVVPEGRMRGV